MKSLAFGDNNVMVHIGDGDSKHSVDIAGYRALEGAQLFVGQRNVSFNLGRSNDLIVMLENPSPLRRWSTRLAGRPALPAPSSRSPVTVPSRIGWPASGISGPWLVPTSSWPTWPVWIRPAASSTARSRVWTATMSAAAAGSRAIWRQPSTRSSTSGSRAAARANRDR